jgi:hypothetical protein
LSATPARRVPKRTQPATALWLDHDTPVGQVAWLEHVDPGLLGVAVVEREDLLDPGTQYYFSPAVRSFAVNAVDRGSAVLDGEVSLGTCPASDGLPPVRFTTGGRPGNLPLSWGAAWDRGREVLTTSRWRWAPELTIHNERRQQVHQLATTVAHVRRDDGLGRLYRHAVDGAGTSYRQVHAAAVAAGRAAAKHSEGLDRACVRVRNEHARFGDVRNTALPRSLEENSFSLSRNEKGKP